MRIDYCPGCGKAGLHYERYLEDSKFNPESGRYEYEDTPERLENLLYRELNKKWCPRCKEWVTPINNPYIRGRSLQ